MHRSTIGLRILAGMIAAIVGGQQAFAASELLLNDDYVTPITLTSLDKPGIAKTVTIPNDPGGGVIDVQAVGTVTYDKDEKKNGKLVVAVNGVKYLGTILGNKSKDGLDRVTIADHVNVEPGKPVTIEVFGKKANLKALDVSYWHDPDTKELSFDVRPHGKFKKIARALGVDVWFALRPNQPKPGNKGIPVKWAMDEQKFPGRMVLKPRSMEAQAYTLDVASSSTEGGFDFFGFVVDVVLGFVVGWLLPILIPYLLEGIIGAQLAELAIQVGQVLLDTGLGQVGLTLGQAQKIGTAFTVLQNVKIEELPGSISVDHQDIHAIVSGARAKGVTLTKYAGVLLAYVHRHNMLGILMREGTIKQNFKPWADSYALGLRGGKTGMGVGGKVVAKVLEKQGHALIAVGMTNNHKVKNRHLLTTYLLPGVPQLAQWGAPWYDPADPEGAAKRDMTAVYAAIADGIGVSTKYAMRAYTVSRCDGDQEGHGRRFLAVIMEDQGGAMNVSFLDQNKREWKHETKAPGAGPLVAVLDADVDLQLPPSTGVPGEPPVEPATYLVASLKSQVLDVESLGRTNPFYPNHCTERSLGPSDIADITGPVGGYPILLLGHWPRRPGETITRTNADWRTLLLKAGSAITFAMPPADGNGKLLVETAQLATSAGPVVYYVYAGPTLTQLTQIGTGTTATAVTAFDYTTKTVDPRYVRIAAPAGGEIRLAGLGFATGQVIQFPPSAQAVGSLGWAMVSTPSQVGMKLPFKVITDSAGTIWLRHKTGKDAEEKHFWERWTFVGFGTHSTRANWVRVALQVLKMKGEKRFVGCALNVRRFPRTSELRFGIRQKKENKQKKTYAKLEYKWFKNKGQSETISLESIPLSQGLLPGPYTFELGAIPLGEKDGKAGTFRVTAKLNGATLIDNKVFSLNGESPVEDLDESKSDTLSEEDQNIEPPPAKIELDLGGAAGVVTKNAKVRISAIAGYRVSDTLSPPAPGKPEAPIGGFGRGSIDEGELVGEEDEQDQSDAPEDPNDQDEENGESDDDGSPDDESDEDNGGGGEED